MMIQFARDVFSENSPVFLLQMLHSIFGHNTICDLFAVFCFAAWLPATVPHDLLKMGSKVSQMMGSSETMLQDAHTSAE